MSLKGINPGRMDRQITIESPTISKNSNGEDVITTWTIVKTCWAEVMRKPGGETTQSGQQIATMPVDYKIRHDSTITQLMRLYEGSSTAKYYFRDVQHWKREGFTMISAERRDN